MSEDEESPLAPSKDIQVFDIVEALEERASRPDTIPGRVDMARSDKCYVALFELKHRGGGEPHTHSHPDSDQILFVLKGELTATGLGDSYPLKGNQGALIPAGVNYGFTTETDDSVVFLSMRTESTGGRRVAYVPDEPSDALLRIPEAQIGARGMGQYLYVYALDRRTIGVSPLLLEEWNRAAILRMNCPYERAGDHIVANLPDRMANWYQLDALTEGDYQIIPDPERTKARIDLSPLINRRAGSR